MHVLLHPTYFPSISHFIAMAKAETLTFEVEDNFQKQTNRNRMYIYSANGMQLLNIPVKHGESPHQKFKDTKIDETFDWRKQHFKALEAAYRSSPFFDYFEDDIRDLFAKKHRFMMDLNFEAMEVINECLGVNFSYNKTTEYLHEVNNDIKDYRHLVNGKKDTTIIEPYTQVFEEKHGFINNLSVLDLLFNEGRYAADYLKKQKLV
ncbi:MAG: hypothetical protein BM557_04545 [Flavobacterium sp. MedPE-SWcel]|uniref:WbqC family protein n=1 Tax=uncultured Flavobacterium sp. TaxID=165435 RepID=UPI00091A8CBF|nr:WbqC family protein [uncultured Flavobacterium sp.]OIQ21034.1 MAG: hypothetical protein BM557_04545 [Flavobacterium sp. MedPE-SWcel]